MPHKRLGKLIIAATPEQAPKLDAIGAAATAGVADLVWLDGGEAARLEPALDYYEALLSPSTGIFDSHEYMLRLLGETEGNGGSFVGRTAITHLSRQPGGWGVHIDGEVEPVVAAERVVNAAGLHAHELANRIERLEPAHRPAVRYARGVFHLFGRGAVHAPDLSGAGAGGWRSVRSRCRVDRCHRRQRRSGPQDRLR